MKAIVYCLALLVLVFFFEASAGPKGKKKTRMDLTSKKRERQLARKDGKMRRNKDRSSFNVHRQGITFSSKASQQKRRGNKKMDSYIPEYDGIEIYNQKSAIVEINGKTIKRPCSIDLDSATFDNTGIFIAFPTESIKLCRQHYNIPRKFVKKRAIKPYWFLIEPSKLVLMHYVEIAGELPTSGPFGYVCKVTFNTGKAKVYQAFNNIETVAVGGNPILTGVFYGDTYPALNTIVYDPDNDICAMLTPSQNIYVYDNDNSEDRDFSQIPAITYPCPDGYSDAVNMGNGPANDCFFNADHTVQMLTHSEWGGLTSMQDISMTGVVDVITHYGTQYENAFFSVMYMAIYVGNGDTKFYPLTSCLDVLAHEIAHMVTYTSGAQLDYSGEAGCINEAFSDMTAETAEAFVYYYNDWIIAGDCTQSGLGIRDMTVPKSYDDYYEGMSLHKCSGIFGYGFYLLSNWNANWQINTAYQLMLLTNSAVWSQSVSMMEAWCGVAWAADVIYGNFADGTNAGCDIYYIGLAIGLDCSTRPQDVGAFIHLCTAA